MDLSELLTRNRDRIIRQWMAMLHEQVSAAYAGQSLETLRRTISAAADANLAVLVRRDFSEMDRVIEWIGRMRSGEGFSLSEVQKAFELYRTILLPILASELDAESLLAAIERVNVCLSYTVHRFSDYFQALHEAEIRAYSQALEVKVEERTRQLAESESKYRTLVEKIRDGYFVNQEGRILFANKAFCAMHGYAKKQVIGRMFIDFVAPESRGEVRQIYSESRREKAAKEQYVYYRLHRNGRALPTENTVTLALYQGKKAAIGICRDITERVEIERRVREAEGLARIGHLTTSLAHEIRNPLSSAKMSVQMILKSEAYEVTDRRRLEILSQQLSRLDRIVTEMLDLARPVKFEFMPADMAETIDNCLEALDAKIKEKNLRVTKSFSTGLPPVCMDREKMEQVVVNLLLNAVEAVDKEGGIDVAACYRKKRKAVEVTIEDNGCGVSPEDLPCLFDPFFSKKARGTGLGLANARRIVEAHQGAIQAAPAKHGGMRFSVFLPLIPHRGRPTDEGK